MTWLLGRGRAPFLAGIALFSAFFALHAARVGVERNNESLRNEGSADAAIYTDFKRTFGNDEDLLLSVTGPKLLEAEGLRLINTLTEEIAQIDGVSRVRSLTNAQRLMSGSSGAEAVPLVAPPLDTPDVATRTRHALDDNPDFTGSLISPDRQTAGLLIEIEDRPTDHQYRGQLIDWLRHRMEGSSSESFELHLTGLSVQKNDVTAYIQRDQKVLMPLAVVVLGVLLGIFFRHRLGVILPLVVNGLTVVWTVGAYQLSGHELNAITSLLPPLLLVISLAVSVHVFQRWLAEEGTGDPVQRVAAAVRAIALPTFFCAITTAQGFLSLATSDMPAVRQFGLFAGLGTAISFAFGITLIPVFLSYVRKPPRGANARPHPWMMSGLRTAARVSTERPIAILAVFFLVTAVLAGGMTRLRNNTDLVRFLKTDAPLYRDTMFIDTHLTGTGAVELVVSRRDGHSLTSLDAVRRLAKLEESLRTLPSVTTTTSVVAVLKQVQRAESGTERLELPDDEAQLAYAFDLLEAAPDQDLLRRMVSADFTRARINVRIHAIGSHESAALIARMEDAAARVLGPDYSIVATGALSQVARDSNRLVEAQVRSFGWALVMVIGAIGLLFRSLRFTIIALIPNIMPILWTFGLMGYVGIDLSSGTAMIASAVLGLTVDDTIHYLEHYRREFHGDCLAAVRATTEAIGAPVTITSVALIFGFWIGCFGSFVPTIYFSLLTGFTFITGIVCELFVIPATLLLMDGVGGTRSPPALSPKEGEGEVTTPPHV